MSDLEKKVKVMQHYIHNGAIPWRISNMVKGVSAIFHHFDTIALKAFDLESRSCSATFAIMTFSKEYQPLRKSFIAFYASFHRFRDIDVKNVSFENICQGNGEQYGY